MGRPDVGGFTRTLNPRWAGTDKSPEVIVGGSAPYYTKGSRPVREPEPNPLEDYTTEQLKAELGRRNQ